LVALFFGLIWPAAADDDATQAEELQIAVQKLRATNTEMRQELDEAQQVIRALLESLAIARTESDLFQQQMADAKLRAQTLGIDFADANATQTQRQLVESVRLFHVADAERQRLAEQLKRLLAAVESNHDVAGEVQRAKTLVATAEVKPAEKSSPARSGLDAAKVLEINSGLRLVVLDVGALHGARVGMPFVVLRGDRVIAQVRVVEVRPRVCGALIETVEKNFTVAAGDSARVTKS
jgi:cell shape-determining protein MreC